ALRTDPFPESAGWTKKSYGFAVKEGCSAIRLTMQRDPSSKFDNLLKGSLWLDAVAVRATAREGGHVVTAASDGTR
ncbi:MAG: hypothetical protein LBP68_01875, partial [Acidobacteriota bacterium]|nr:hypothetical protein [Acidobacteriota bacterium]